MYSNRCRIFKNKSDALFIPIIFYQLTPNPFFSKNIFFGIHFTLNIRIIFLIWFTSLQSKTRISASSFLAPTISLSFWSSLSTSRTISSLTSLPLWVLSPREREIWDWKVSAVIYLLCGACLTTLRGWCWMRKDNEWRFFCGAYLEAIHKYLAWKRRIKGINTELRKF